MIYRYDVLELIREEKYEKNKSQKLGIKGLKIYLEIN